MSSQMAGKQSSLYVDAMEYVSAYNSMLANERRQRPEHWDAYTSVHQRPCYLWKTPFSRRSCNVDGRVYSYPSRPWRVKKGWTPAMVKQPPAFAVPLPAPPKPSNPYQTRSADRPRTHYVEANTTDESDEGGADSDAEFINDASSDSEVYHKSSRRPNRRTYGAATTSCTTDSRSAVEEPAPVINCNMCGRICKTPQGLLLHLNSYPSHRQAHAELQQEEAPESEVASSHEATPSVHEETPAAVATATTAAVPAPVVKQKVASNDYCDFCLGTSAENKKTNKPESLVSCGDCGRSGHPSCLQFTADLVANVQQYHWQCIECKSCGVCGSSDNDDQLLFCDDCDRGYHMFCLSPPISEPPEGKWSCIICIKRGAKPGGKSGRRKKRGRHRKRLS